MLANHRGGVARRDSCRCRRRVAQAVVESGARQQLRSEPALHRASQQHGDDKREGGRHDGASPRLGHAPPRLGRHEGLIAEPDHDGVHPAPLGLGRPLFAPPGVPAERVAALRADLTALMVHDLRNPLLGSTGVKLTFAQKPPTVILLAWVGGVIVGLYRRDPASRMSAAAFIAVFSAWTCFRLSAGTT